MTIEKAKGHVRKIVPRLLEQQNAELHESVQSSIKMAREQMVRSRHIVSESQAIIMRVRSALADAARIQLGTLGEYPRNPMIACEQPGGRKPV